MINCNSCCAREYKKYREFGLFSWKFTPFHKEIYYHFSWSKYYHKTDNRLENGDPHCIMYLKSEKNGTITVEMHFLLL